MYLVSSDDSEHHPPTHTNMQEKQTIKNTNNRVHKRRNNTQQKTRNPYDECIKFREKMHKNDAKEKMYLKTIADFLKIVSPDATFRATLLNHVLPVKQVSSKHESGTQTDKRVKVNSAVSYPQDVVYEAGPSTSYTTPKKATATEDDNEDDNDYIDEEVESFGKRHFGTRASPYLTPYV
jgi:hypothetical protein